MWTRIQPLSKSLLSPSLFPSFSLVGKQSLPVISLQRHYGIAQVKKLAPTWSGPAVVGNEFKTISSEDYKGRWLVLFFYPLDFTFVCPTELIAFSERIQEFEALQCSVVGASVDSKFTHKAWIETPRKKGGLGRLSYPLLADLTKKISSDFGVLVPEDGLALRGTFVIDPKGIIRHLSVNDLDVGRSVDETLRLVEGFQFADEHQGLVCPAGWKKGDKTINTSKSSDYFSTLKE